MTVEENKESKENKELTLHITGRVDAITSPELEKFIFERITGLTELTLDFTEVVYISSAGLRVLIGAYKTMENQNGKLVLSNVSGDVEDTLYITGCLEFLEVWNRNGERVMKGKGNTHGGQEDRE